MKNFVVIFAVLLTSQCVSQPVEESVVSVYTTQTTGAGSTAPIGVYRQIANNIAERITSPIFRLFGINSTTTIPPPTTKRGFDQLELSDDQDLANKHEIKPVNNDISQERDVEELSVEALRKIDKKPEKITLYSSYLPIKSIVNDTMDDKSTNNTDDDFDSFELETFDEDDQTNPREGPIIYWLELFGSMLQLLWGGIMALFRPSNPESS